MCSERRHDDVVGEPLGGDAAAVVADERDRRRPRRRASASASTMFARAAARRERDAPRRPRGRTRSSGAGRATSGPMSLASAVRIDGSAVEVERPPRPASLRRGAEVGDEVHRRRSPSRRCRTRAACRPPSSARRTAAAAPRARRAPSPSVCAAQLADLLRLEQHGAAHVLDAPPPCRPRAAPGTGRGTPSRRRPRLEPRGARGRRAPAPRARGRASRRAPGARRGPRWAAREPLASASPADRERRSGSNAIRPKSSGRRRARPAVAPAGGSASAGSARLPTITGWTNSTATWCASDHACGEPPIASSRPPRDEALGQREAEARDALGLAGEEALAGLGRRAEQLLDARARARPSHAARAPWRPRASAIRGTPRRPRPCARSSSMRSARRGARRRGGARKRSRSKSRCGSRSILLTITSVARAEHERVLERLVLALGDRRDHHAVVLADAELGRADEVADVLDHQQVELVERQRRERRAHHVGVEVALAAEARVGVDLRRRARAGAAMRSASSVVCTSPSSTPDAHAVEAAQRRAPAASSCPAPGRAHEVDHGDARALEVGAVGGGDRAVGVERRPRAPSRTCDACVLLDLDRLDQELVARDDRDVAAAAAGQRKAARRSSHSCPQAAQRSSAGTISSSSRAPSQTVPRATRSK